MSYEELKIKRHYFSPSDDVVKDFFIPVLSQSVTYDRAAGFFSSSSLIEVSVGICELVKSGGKIRVIASPNLSKDDVEAIKNGYELKNVARNAMIRDFEHPSDSESINRLSFLENLISNGFFEIKIALMKNIDLYPDSMFHPKFGIMQDADGNRISFVGSMNSSKNALGGNWENVSTSYSMWDVEGIEELSNKFERLWSDVDDSAFVIDAREIVSDMLSHYHTEYIDYTLDDYFKSKKESIFFKCPSYIKLEDYQKSTISRWIENEYCGIFDMATGSGKTITALCALEKLYNNEDGGIFTIIVCPQIHLVDQWAENVREFGVEPIIGYSNSPSGDWKNSVKRLLLRSKSGKLNSCLITTNSSFVKKDVQELLKTIKTKFALVIDEAHNIGSELGLSALPNNATYRIALSATIERYKDKRGTESLKSYFGQECAGYTLEKAIGKRLTPYNYHPIPCVMSESEYQRIIDINDRIELIMNDPHIPESKKLQEVKELNVHGVRILSSLNSKFDTLKFLGNQMIDESHILVYCGKGKWVEDEIDLTEHAENVRIIDRAVEILGHNGLGMNVSRFTCTESPKERKEIKTEFTEGRTSVMIAISCLDEGVDIPAIKTAIITSSSDNPKEYIQRRGRVLRKFPGKDCAEIYDLISIPVSLDESNCCNLNYNTELKLLSKELNRIIEFSRLAKNPEETNNLIKKIEKSYNTDLNSIMAMYPGYDDE